MTVVDTSSLVVGTYVVEEGDTARSVALPIYERGESWKYLAIVNPYLLGQPSAWKDAADTLLPVGVTINIAVDMRDAGIKFKVIFNEMVGRGKGGPPGVGGIPPIGSNPPPTGGGGGGGVADRPLWTEDGPTYYNQAFAYHKPWATEGPYQTVLSVDDEDDFEDWVTTYSVPFNITDTIVGYDFRGYWVTRVKGTSIGYTVGEHPPDIWLTPYSTRFSDKSKYARPGTPYHWHGDKLIDAKTGATLFWANFVAPADTAVDYIERSKIDPRSTTKGLMGDDLDMQSFKLYFQQQLRLRADDQVLDAEVSRTIEGASTITVTLDDTDRTILRSGLLAKKLDFKLDGLWFRLCQVSKDQGDTLTLTFEAKEISLLRGYSSFIWQKKDGYHTRARFILRMIREVTSMRIPVVIPALNIVQPVEGQPTNADGSRPQEPANAGLPTDPPDIPDPDSLPVDPRKNLMVKTVKADAAQIANVNKILAEGVRQGARRKVLVCSIMTAIQESEIRNLPGEPYQGHMINVGVFQQDSRYWPASNDVTKDAGAFFRSAIAEDRKNPSLSYNDLCQKVQGSAFPNAYGQWKGQAENWVTAYGIATDTPIQDAPVPLVPGLIPPPPITPDGGIREDHTFAQAGINNTVFYYRGVPSQDGTVWGKEDSWTCIGRLANEVNWRAFFVGGTFWYISDSDLFKMKPIMTITESSRGIRSISFDYDNNKKLATITIQCRIGRWIAQPGAVVVIKDMGPINGRWLVNEFTRSLFDLEATIVLKKPLPDLPEPATSISVTPPAAIPPGPPLFQKGIVIPIHALATHQTSGLAGYPAVDFIMNSSGDTVSGADDSAMGQPVMFEEGGLVRDVHLKEWVKGFGGVTFYMAGDSGADYFVTHLDESSPVRAGRIEPAQVIGYLTKNLEHSKLINHAHVHVGSTKYDGPL